MKRRRKYTNKETYLGELAIRFLSPKAKRFWFEADAILRIYDISTDDGNRYDVPAIDIYGATLKEVEAAFEELQDLADKIKEG